MLWLSTKFLTIGVETPSYLCGFMNSAGKFIGWVVIPEEEWYLYSWCTGLLGHLVLPSKSVNHEQEHRSSGRNTLRSLQQHLSVSVSPAHIRLSGDIRLSGCEVAPLGGFALCSSGDWWHWGSIICAFIGHLYIFLGEIYIHSLH